MEILITNNNDTPRRGRGRPRKVNTQEELEERRRCMNEISKEYYRKNKDKIAEKRNSDEVFLKSFREKSRICMQNLRKTFVDETLPLTKIEDECFRCNVCGSILKCPRDFISHKKTKRHLKNEHINSTLTSNTENVLTTPNF